MVKILVFSCLFLNLMLGLNGFVFFRRALSVCSLYFPCPYAFLLYYKAI